MVARKRVAGNRKESPREEKAKLTIGSTHWVKYRNEFPCNPQLIKSRFLRLFCLGLAEIVETRPSNNGKGEEYYIHYKNCTGTRGSQALRLTFSSS